MEDKFITISKMVLTSRVHGILAHLVRVWNSSSKICRSTSVSCRELTYIVVVCNDGYNVSVLPFIGSRIIRRDLGLYTGLNGYRFFSGDYLNLRLNGLNFLCTARKNSRYSGKC